VARHPRRIPSLSRLNDHEDLSTFAQTINSTFAQSPTLNRQKIDIVPSIAENQTVKTLTEVLPDVDQLSEEEQAGLAAHLLANLRGAPLGPDDKEVARREAEIDAGTAELITFDELRKAVGR
jgi:hypothetical protein